MPTFAELLATLPSVEHLAAIEIRAEAGGDVLSRIENKPGQAGSLRVYHALWQQHGALSPEAASTGLRLYAEHTADAEAHPGKHPNIDRLFTIVAARQSYHLTPIRREGERS